MLIVSIPNPFHILSRLLFLKNSNMPRWTKKNNHITVFTKDILFKLFKKYKLVKIEFFRGELTYGIFKKFDGKYPENEWFGHFMILIFQKE